MKVNYQGNEQFRRLLKQYESLHKLEELAQRKDRDGNYYNMTVTDFTINQLVSIPDKGVDDD